MIRLTMPERKSFLFPALMVAVALLAGGCASPDGPAAEQAPAGDAMLWHSPWAQASAISPDASRAPGWRHFALPGKAPTQFAYMRHDGRDAMAVLSVASASMVRKDVRVEAAQLGALLFSWQVPELIAGADMAVRDTDDSPVRLVLVFEGDRSKFSARNAMLSELSRALTGEEMPYATLMYVWANEGEAGRVIVNPRTDRIRKLVVEAGAGGLGRWLDYERDVRADFERAFGEPAGALVGVGLMTDSDNTRSRAQAWYGPVRLLTVAQD
jgi:hypothetical protein